jgi:hypothetical protein
MGFDNPVETDVYDYGLFLLNKILQDTGHFLANFGMPLPQRDWTAAVENPLVVEQLDYNPAEERAQADESFERMTRNRDSPSTESLTLLNRTWARFSSSAAQAALEKPSSITPLLTISEDNPALFSVSPHRASPHFCLKADAQLILFSRSPLMG